MFADMVEDHLQSPEYAIDRQIDEVIKKIATLSGLSDRASLERRRGEIARLQELLAQSSRLMRPPVPTPPARGVALV